MNQGASERRRGVEYTDRISVDARIMWLGLFVLGIGFGVVVVERGLPWWFALLTSTFILAGSLEFLLAGLVTLHSSLISIAVITFLVNSRHIFYSLSFPMESHEGPLAKVYSAFAMVDEAYALVALGQGERLRGRKLLKVQLGLHGSWAFGATVGALVGNLIPKSISGFGFVLTALFVVLSIDSAIESKEVSTGLIAVLVAIVSFAITPSSMLIVAIFTFFVLLLAKDALRARARTRVVEEDNDT
ncbi:MAG: AzlC family ABC transporter permease [Actinomycetota bacterium]|nr:AzlC family ABC transporter permease [Actinomycetota bacterium]